MMDRFVYEYAIEAIFNEGLENVVEQWECPVCGHAFIKISCSKPHLRQDLLLENEQQGAGWKIVTAVYPEFDIENSCECRSERRRLSLVQKDKQDA